MSLRNFLLALLCVWYSTPARAFEPYQWIVLATVAEPIAIGNPYPCGGVEFTWDCTNVFFDVPLRIKDVLGSRGMPVPKSLVTSNHSGIDPFLYLTGRRHLYLIYAIVDRGVPRIGVKFEVVKTRDGPAIYARDLFVDHDDTDCEGVVRDLRFVSQKYRRSMTIDESEPYWQGEALTKELEYGVREGDILWLTRGVLVKDLAVGARAMRLSCVTARAQSPAQPDPSQAG